MCLNRIELCGLLLSGWAFARCKGISQVPLFLQPPTPWSLGLNAIPAPPSPLHWKVGGLFTRAPELLCGSAFCLWEGGEQLVKDSPLPLLSFSLSLFPFLQNQFEKDRRPSQPPPHTPVMLSWWVHFHLFHSALSVPLSLISFGIFHLNFRFVFVPQFSLFFLGAQFGWKIPNFLLSSKSLRIWIAVSLFLSFSPSLNVFLPST